MVTFLTLRGALCGGWSWDGVTIAYHDSFCNPHLVSHIIKHKQKERYSLFATFFAVPKGVIVIAGDLCITLSRLDLLSAGAGGQN